MAGGRPTVWTDEKKKQLKAIMRLRPSLEDTAAFLDIHPDTVAKHIKHEHGCSFPEFRDQNMVHTRFMLIRKALKEAENGNTAMLIFSLKNLCGWQDKVETTMVGQPTIKIQPVDEDL
jgi:hypothetical protein